MTNQEAIRLIRNLSTMCVFTDAYGEPIDSDAYYEAVDMAISALQALDEIYAFIMKSEASETTDGVLEIYDALEAQEAKTQLSAEGTTSDLISRQDAIEVIEEMQMPIMRSMFPEEQFVFKGMSEALSAIKDLPSAQPESEERKAESAQNVPKEDLISRKEAIDALDCINGTEEVLRSLPSAQPEPQWISVTERLPESKPEDLEYPTVIACCEDGEVMTACYYESTKEWGIGENYDRKINPVAWMPLPETYRAERRTDA